MIAPKFDIYQPIMSLQSMVEQSQVNMSMNIQMAMLTNRLDMMQTECCYDGSDRHPVKTNCINCGASLSGRHLCEYCGTYNK